MKYTAKVLWIIESKLLEVYLVTRFLRRDLCAHLVWNWCFCRYAGDPAGNTPDEAHSSSSRFSVLWVLERHGLVMVFSVDTVYHDCSGSDPEA